MADAEPAVSSPSTPGSTSGAHNGLKAAKDRNCPFCGQAFTSSSLGRHLDLYIKPKNPKPPDGVHDVNEIRRMRSTITRRQPRTSMKMGSNRDSLDARESSAWSQSNEDKLRRSDGAFTKESYPPARGSSHAPDVDAERDGRQQLSFAKWQATGVINDIPSRRSDDDNNNNNARLSQAERSHDTHRDAMGFRVQRPDYDVEHTWKLQEQAEVGRAAELALREVLGSLQAAKTKTDTQLLFPDIDLFSLSFPGLCLALLPPPPTLFSASPFPTAHAWFLEPPGRREFEALNRAFGERIQSIRSREPNGVPDSALFRHYAHVQGAFEHWQSMSEAEQREAWRLEMMRAFVRQREQNEKQRNELEHALARIRHLEFEYDRLSRCQLPRDYLLHPPNTIPIPSTVHSVMQTSQWQHGVAEANYDADALINKWRATVKATARPPRSSNVQNQSQPVSYETVYSESSRNQLKADFIMNGSVTGINSPAQQGDDFAVRQSHDPAITYRTPPEPGVIIDAEDDRDTSNNDAGDTKDGTLAGKAGPASVGADNSPGVYDIASGELNANGKRPLPTNVVVARNTKAHKDAVS